MQAQTKPSPLIPILVTIGLLVLIGFGILVLWGMRTIRNYTMDYSTVTVPDRTVVGREFPIVIHLQTPFRGKPLDELWIEHSYLEGIELIWSEPQWQLIEEGDGWTYVGVGTAIPPGGAQIILGARAKKEGMHAGYIAVQIYEHRPEYHYVSTYVQPAP